MSAKTWIESWFSVLPMWAAEGLVDGRQASEAMAELAAMAEEIG